MKRSLRDTRTPPRCPAQPARQLLVAANPKAIRVFAAAAGAQLEFRRAGSGGCQRGDRGER
jgi:hypothetical protein